MENLTYLSSLSREFGTDHSNLRKYVIKKGINYVMSRDAASRQMAMAFTAEEAEKLRSLRMREGFTKSDVPICINGEIGEFYVVQLIPELDPRRVKLGFANGVLVRLASHRTASPTAVLIKSWDCKRTWERAAMDSSTRIGCKLIANEVYECDSVEQVTNRLDKFFAVMPAVRQL